MCEKQRGGAVCWRDLQDVCATEGVSEIVTQYIRPVT